jgi:hypothetical protein
MTPPRLGKTGLLRHAIASRVAAINRVERSKSILEMCET